jgi:hypothetical protein
MQRSKNNLSPAQKKELTGYFIVLVVLLVILFFLFFNQKKNSKIEENISFSSVKIALLNGCGYNNVAKEVKDNIIDKNISNLDIISWKNIESKMFIYDKSIIVIKKYNKEKLDFLVNITGINRRIFAINDNYIEEYQIILGKDYKKYFK